MGQQDLLARRSLRRGAEEVGQGLRGVQRGSKSQQVTKSPDPAQTEKENGFYQLWMSAGRKEVHLPLVIQISSLRTGWM